MARKYPFFTVAHLSIINFANEFLKLKKKKRSVKKKSSLLFVSNGNLLFKQGFSLQGPIRFSLCKFDLFSCFQILS